MGDDVPVVGRDVEAAANAVLDADPSRERETVRAVLDGVADDGAVTVESLDERTGETALVVSTAENRAEFAGTAVAEAREAAANVDLEAADARIDRFTATLSEIEDDLDALRAGLADATAGLGSEATYATVRALHDVEMDAKAVQRTADELRADAEEFERQVREPARWVDALDGDVDALDGALDDLANAVETVGDSDDPAAAWADARLRTAAYGLLLEDLRAELGDLRAWPGGAPDGVETTGERLAALDDRLATIRDGLDDRGREAWRERYGEDVERFERHLAGHDPPVGWESVQAALNERLAAVTGGDRAQ